MNIIDVGGFIFVSSYAVWSVKEMLKPKVTKKGKVKMSNLAFFVLIAFEPIRMFVSGIETIALGLTENEEAIEEVCEIEEETHKNDDKFSYYV